MKNLPNFNEAYYSLNQQQKKAVDQIDGAVVAIAGPGTGKTHMLGCRAANMLRSTNHQIDPANILCLTYTDAGCIAMRKRLLDMIGPDAYKVGIFTFHAFANEVVQNNLDRLGIRNVEPVSDLEKISILHEMIDELSFDNPLKRLRGDIYYEAPRIDNLIQLMKREGWDYQRISQEAEEYLEALENDDRFRYKRANAKKEIKVGDLKVKEYQAEVDRMLLLVSAADQLDVYNEKLKAMERFDYADMLGWIRNIFKNYDDVLLNYQERYQYIMVDESQDTTELQFSILNLLIEFWENPNVFVVGDDKQCIYEFAGSRINNLVSFINKHKPTVVNMVENYRSSQCILDVSSNVIRNNNMSLASILDLSVELNGNTGEGIKPSVVEYHTAEEEACDVAQQIDSLLKADVQPNEIAVIYRKHSQAESIEKVLRSWGIPVNIKRRLDVLQQPIVHQVINIMRYLVAKAEMKYEAKRLEFEILHYRCFGIPTYQVEEYMNASKDNEVEVTEQRNELLNAFIDLIVLEEEYHNTTLINLIEKIFEKTGILGNCLNSTNRQQDLSILKTFFDFVKGEVSKNADLKAADLVRMIDRMKEHNVRLECNDYNYAEEGVSFCTAHGSKGLEWKFVFMVGCNRKVWEKARTGFMQYKLPETLTYATQEDVEETNRRLFYVAMTRAKQVLQISYAAKDSQGKELEASQYVGETGLDVDVFEGVDLTQHLYHSLQPESTVFVPALESELIERKLENYTLSASHLNNYLRCPVSFYYEYILKVPFASNDAMIYGNAVHYAMKHYGDEVKNAGVPLGVNLLVKYFEEYMERNRGYLTRDEHVRRLELGLLALSKYHAQYPMSSMALNEFHADRVVIDGVPCKGDLDRMEFNGNNVSLVDYKTGSGSTAKRLAKPNEDYWRELNFHALLVDGQYGKKWKAQSAVLHIVDPKDMGEIPVDISDASQLMVRKQIREVYDKIKAQQFSEGCGDENCVWCNLQKHK